MPPVSPSGSMKMHRVHVFDCAYTLAASADSCPRLDELARQLDLKIREHHARQPAAAPEQLAVIAALELLHAVPEMADARNIGNQLNSLQRKIERLEALLMPSSALSPEPPSDSP